MPSFQDYIYRFPRESYQLSGRCRVRIYKRKNGSHIVLLTDVSNNTGESITTASARIATDLLARWNLNPKTTRWIQHTPPEADLPAEFAHLTFTWGADKRAEAPQWQPFTAEQVERLTGEPLNALNRRLGDFDLKKEERI
ncbi:MAG: hypothetical protein KF893_10255 [Caldilineaceae bacterium]|nr:hypothetical protein [Caldilineaceae bacterium]